MGGARFGRGASPFSGYRQFEEMMEERRRSRSFNAYPLGRRRARKRAISRSERHAGGTARGGARHRKRLSAQSAEPIQIRSRILDEKAAADACTVFPRSSLGVPKAANRAL